jgi:hypothetical protein
MFLDIGDKSESLRGVVHFCEVEEASEVGRGQLTFLKAEKASDPEHNPSDPAYRRILVLAR